MKRRDLLRGIESEVQQWWEEESQFNADPDPSKEPFFINFPFPYMNGRLHLGHAYSLTKSDFTAGYQRLIGKNVLFPFGFHLTGMPIQGAATKLRQEIEMYGIPPNPNAIDPEGQTSSDSNPNKPKAGNKSKVAAKTGGAKLQWDILKMIGIPEEDIPKFQDPIHWLHYFPPLGERDLKKFGISCDWRRSFITTSENKFFDRFVRWQFWILKEKNRIQFGQRPTIYSPLDKQACTDHDRSSGEGVLPQEYTLIKLKVIQDISFTENKSFFSKFDTPLQVLKNQTVFLVAATLRPETMYGQTNCFVLPDGEYLVVQMKNNEVFVCSERSAKNMSYQDLMPDFGKVTVLFKIKGKELVGLALKAPRSIYDKVFTLPLLSISMNKGTGVVTSVPSDAPDDYAALRDWQTDEKLRFKYGVRLEWVQTYEVVPIISIPGYGDRAAVTLCEKYEVKSHTGAKDKQKLADIKAEVYKKGFYEGVMIVGDQSIKGKKVCDVKDVAKKQMVASNEALVYFEPESEVVSRSGDECVVTYLDQWYLNYGEENWKNMIKQHINDPSRFTTYNPVPLKNFNETLDWLTDWACSRSFGLGTKVPWDEQFVIESLSDSTIYMAYYTINYKLQGRVNGSLSGEFGSPLGIDIAAMPEEESNKLFSYIFLGKGDINGNLKSLEKFGVKLDSLVDLRSEFEYWYPFDLRTSGKDLIKNHLTMCLYNHAAIWDDRPELWPRSFFTNGQILVDAVKMSKSVGNFIMLTEAVEGEREQIIQGNQVTIGWCADATRFACADAGDTMEDSNFSCDTANSIILRLTTELEFVKAIFQLKSSDTVKDVTDSLAALRITPISDYNYHDKAFLNKMNHCIRETKLAYESMRFRDVVKHGFYNMQTIRDTYRDACGKMGIAMDETLIKEFLIKQVIIISPVCKHWSEYIWRTIINKDLAYSQSVSVTRQTWPEAAAVDIPLMRTADFIDNLIQRTRKTYLEMQGKRQKSASGVANVTSYTKGEIFSVHVYLSRSFPEWKRILLEFISELYEDNQKVDLEAALLELKQFCADHPVLRENIKQAMQVGSFVLRKSEQEGAQAYEKTLLFDQKKVLLENKEYISRAVGTDIREIIPLYEDEVKDVDKADLKVAAEAEPGSPTYSFVLV